MNFLKRKSLENPPAKVHYKNLSDWFNGVFDDDFFDYGFSKTQLGNFDWSPKMDVFEDGKSFWVKADIPGISQNEIKVELEDNILSIKGERECVNEKKSDRVHLSERCKGVFKRTVELPQYLDTQKLNAVYKNGVLSIEIPKAKSTETKKFNVKIQ